MPSSTAALEAPHNALPSPDSTLPSPHLTPSHDSDSDDEGHGFTHDPTVQAFKLETIVHRPPPLRNDGFQDDDDDDDGEEEEEEEYSFHDGLSEGDGDGKEEGEMRMGRGTRQRRMSKDSFMLYTPDEEKQVVRKLDRNLVLFVALLYMFSFLDRSNIGNARIAGMSRDLKLSSSQYEWLLTAFYVTYILFEWMVLLYKVLPPRLYISICVLSWGLVASVQSLATSFGTMVLLRALLGIGEAAFSPGVPFYFSFFFKRDELAFRTGLFISAAPLATSFASSLAWAITKLGERSPVAAWRLLFLIEGFPGIVVAIVAFYIIPDSPSTARFLSPRQRKVARLRLRKNTPTPTTTTTRKQTFQWRLVLSTLLDPKSYLFALIFFACNIAFSSLPPFLPTIIHAMGFSALASQALSFPPYLLSFLWVLLPAVLSDRYRSRAVFVFGNAMLSLTGYAIIATAGALQAGPAWRYAGVYPAAAGFFGCVTIVITWQINNGRSEEGRGTGLAMINVIGQFGPLVGTRLYPDADAPYYVRGMSICTACMALVGILALVLRWVLQRENGKVGYRKVGEEGQDEGKGVGEEWRYML